MNAGPQAALLPDGRRLHLHEGPIDLIVEAFGPEEEVCAAYARAVARFRPILSDLVGELAELRRPIGDRPLRLRGAVARRMLAAVERHRGVFVTPMAAVAGAVADEVLAAMLAGGALDRAYVNDGGDIALHLAPGTVFDVGLVTRLDRPSIDATARIEAASPVRGVATSGRGGRSLSMGIADAVTVLAGDAAAADVAATLIADAVDVDSPAVVRRPAREVRDDSDLGDLPVVVAVGPLSDDDVGRALDAGLAAAETMRRRGLIEGAFVALDGRHRASGLPVAAVGTGGRARVVTIGTTRP